ncbi:MAG: CoA pyrophosphatase [Clostridiaceae bacterium]
MTEKIINIFKNRKRGVIGDFKRSAVMIFLMKDENKEETSILFEVRAKSLRRQPGDICLPGGRVEKGEEPLDAACRESIEELNITRESFEVIGEMDFLVTPYTSIIYPYISTMENQEIAPNLAEVDKVLKVPLKFFLETEPDLHEVEIVQSPKDDFPYDLIQNGSDYKFTSGILPEYFYVYEGNVIWGFTALIIKKFVDIIKKSQNITEN